MKHLKIFENENTNVQFQCLYSIKHNMYIVYNEMELGLTFAPLEYAMLLPMDMESPFYRDEIEVYDTEKDEMVTLNKSECENHIFSCNIINRVQL